MNAPERPKRIAFVGGYEPRRCGIATFTRDLCEAVSAAEPSAECIVGAVNDRCEGYSYPPKVRFEIMENNLDSYRSAADFTNFNLTDVLCVQHEFGIYGGLAGSHLLALLKEVRMPVVTTLHTVLSQPNEVQRKVMDELADLSDRLVTMACKGAEILHESYGIPEAKIDVIPHGIPDIPFAAAASAKAQFGVEGRTLLLTFGLLGPGKGIEHAIEALPEIVEKHPEVVYLVLGATHPNLLAREGESYRLSLERLAAARGVKKHVIFHNRFVSQEDLTQFIAATDIYLTPYLNEEQITSGTLAYAFGSGKAVVSTPYWHAQELLGHGRGILVPFRDAKAIAKAVIHYLDNPEWMARTREEAYRCGREMIWPEVAQRYLETFQHALADRRAITRMDLTEYTLAKRHYGLPPRRLDHIKRMSDDTGIFQHAIYSVPNFHEGYCIDDNARAYILCVLLEELNVSSPTEDLDLLSTRYLAFLAAAWNEQAGRFRNFMTHDRQWLEKAGSEDSHARALWALGVGAGHSFNEGHRRLCAQLFEKGLPIVETFTSPRAWAFAILGIHEYLRKNAHSGPAIALRKELTARLVTNWRAHATDDWPWFENSVTYENARLCQALILSGQWMPDDEALEIGLQSLAWLVAQQSTPDRHFRPIGSNGFYVKDGSMAEFDQQPIEAQAMIAACLEARRATQDEQWSIEAKRAFEWFLGRNDLGLPLYDPKTGGCSDGLHRDRVNENQGAESSLAFHISLAEMNCAEQLVEHPISIHA